MHLSKWNLPRRESEYFLSSTEIQIYNFPHFLYRPVVVTVLNEDCFETVLVLASLKENELKRNRKPKNITNYKALLGSFITSNKRKSSDGDKTTAQNRKSSKEQKKKQPPEESLSDAPPNFPAYSESDLRNAMKTPQISMVSNQESNLAKKRKSLDPPLSQLVNELSESQNNAVDRRESNKKRRTNCHDEGDENDISIVNRGATTSHYFAKGIRQVLEKQQENEVDLDKTNSQLQLPDSDFPEMPPPIQNSSRIDDESEDVVPNPIPYMGSSEFRVPSISNRRSSAPLFTESDIDRDNTFQRQDKLQIKTANRKSNLIFCNVVRSNVITDGLISVAPNSDDETD